MLITTELLKAKKACSQGIRWFEYFFPEGIDSKELAMVKHIPLQFLFWGYDNLNPTEEEKQIYRERLNIQSQNPNSIIQSSSIYDSEEIINSESIYNSNYVTFSKHIKDSEIIQFSNNIQSSQHIVKSADITNSRYCFESRNILNSYNIIQSSFIEQSKNIINSNNINQSFYIVNSHYNNNCAFIADSNDLTHCLFCNQINNESYMMFNKPISKEDFNKYYNQILIQLSSWQAKFIHNWNIRKMPLDMPLLNPSERYCRQLPLNFLQWIKSLPNFDSNIFYSITGISLN